MQIRSDEVTTVVATLRLPRNAARRLRLTGVIASARGRTVAGRPSRLTLGFGRAARRALRGVDSVTLVLELVAKDTAGNSTRHRRRITLR